MSLFEEIANRILDQIESGRYKAGASLPPEGQLQKDYEVSRTTIRRAIDLLVAQNKVVRKKGVGLFVAPNLSAQNILEMTGVIKAINYQDQKTVVKEAYLRQIGPYYAKLLKLKPAELIYFISFLEVRKTNVVKENFILPLDYFPDFQISTIKVLSPLEIANSGKRRVDKLEQDLQLVMANAELSKQLKIELKDPLFKITNSYFDGENQPIAIEYKYANDTSYVVDFT